MKTILTILSFIALSQAEDNLETVLRDLESLQVKSRHGTRIIKSQQESEKKFPHQALLFISKSGTKFQCGGSLISELWIASAAHCSENATSIQAKLGSKNKNSMPVQRSIVKIHKLDSYERLTFRDDITLLKLNSRVLFTTNVQPILLPTKSQASTLYLNTILVISGFGLTTSNTLLDELHYTSVIGISNDGCKSVYGSMITQSTVCAVGYPNKNQNTCNGDLGGPVIIEGDNSRPVLVGIISFVPTNSCLTGTPQGFTRVNSYLSWINDVTGIPLREN